MGRVADEPRNEAGAEGGIEQLRDEVAGLRADIAQRDRWVSDHVVDRLNALTAQVDGLRAELSR